jgi:hypothetical protein
MSSALEDRKRETSGGRGKQVDGGSGLSRSSGLMKDE